MDKLAILEALYASEINFSLSTFWDGGFDWKLGDEMNGVDTYGCASTVNEAIEQLAAAAHIHYPESQFHLGAEEFNRRHRITA